MAASRPLPGPLTKTSTCRMPWSIALCAACWAAICAAYGVLFRDPLKPDVPALLQATALPMGSVSVINVLLKVDWIYAFPFGIDFRSRLLARLFVFFSATDAILSGFYFLAIARRLAQFWAAFAPATQVPPPGLLGSSGSVRRAYIYSPEQIRDLLAESEGSSGGHHSANAPDSATVEDR